MARSSLPQVFEFLLIKGLQVVMRDNLITIRPEAEVSRIWRSEQWLIAIANADFANRSAIGVQFKRPIPHLRIQRLVVRIAPWDKPKQHTQDSNFPRLLEGQPVPRLVVTWRILRPNAKLRGAPLLARPLERLVVHRLLAHISAAPGQWDRLWIQQDVSPLWDHRLRTAACPSQETSEQ